MDQIKSYEIPVLEEIGSKLSVFAGENTASSGFGEDTGNIGGGF